MAEIVKASPGAVFAVLTGDVIASTAFPAGHLDAVRRVIVEAIDRLRHYREGTIRGSPQFFRGDAWQVLLNEPASALRLALLIRARLRAQIGADSRVSIGIGGVGQIAEDRISMSTGEAFTLSGRALDRMTLHFDLTGALPEHAGPMALWMPTVMHLCSGLTRRWTRRQAELVAEGLVLENPTQARIAKSLSPKITKQTAQESLASAGWRPLIDAVWTFEHTDWQAVAGGGPSPGIVKTALSSVGQDNSLDRNAGA